ncbi:MAG: 2,3-bisphosphoglycerate-independent phosphoglycerate mutase [Candidatus Eisenbacteria bacterium]|nr:2,3-bisphosphoglycerate-independent phosphoglycerate mutase [Candidatus Eisenbacteria bacterium]
MPEHVLKPGFPVMLLVMDGWGLAKDGPGNAVSLARLPNMKFFGSNFPCSRLLACEGAVGLPQGQMGNSEVGHLNLGAGRIVYQEFTRIDKAIEDGSFVRNEQFLRAIDHARKSGSSLHLMGLVSDGGVHSHVRHLSALLGLALKRGMEKVFIHAFLDGRDVPPKSALEYLGTLEDDLKKLRSGKIATVMGRYYGMDRDKRWDRVEKAFDAIARGSGIKVKTSLEAVERAYERAETDEFVLPTVIETTEGKPVGPVSEHDSIIFFNFRPDRAREITRAFTEIKFDGFERKRIYSDLCFVCMTQYQAGIPAAVAFPLVEIKDTLGEVLSKRGLTQLRIAETEKYAHVTFFFNGGDEKAFPGEDRFLVQSPNVATYDLMPQMSAYGVADEAEKRILSRSYDFIVLNFANADMVGHTGVIPAAVAAVEAVDECAGRIVSAVQGLGGTAFITSDHGNADAMLDEEGKEQTAHSMNPVPAILVSRKKFKGLRDGILADVAPTVLDIMGIEKPPAMTGQSLLIR